MADVTDLVTPSSSLRGQFFVHESSPPANRPLETSSLAPWQIFGLLESGKSQAHPAEPRAHSFGEIDQPGSAPYAIWFKEEHHSKPRALTFGDLSTEKQSAVKHSPNVAIAPEAEDRIRGHDVVLEYVESVAVETASNLHVPIRRLIVAPARSHEYDDRTGIVVKIELEVDGERRFVLWEAICEKLDEQKDRLNSEERRFLDDDVSVVVGGY